MGHRSLIPIGGIGSSLAALFGFTAFLSVVLGAVGLLGLLGVLYSDLLLIPALLIFLGILGIGLWKKIKSN